MDAESKATEFTEWLHLFRTQNEAELAEWLRTFKTGAQSDIAQWHVNFTTENSRIFSEWYSAFTADSESDFQAWFAALQNTLDENQASNLYSKIDRHETTYVSDPGGVHGLRLYGRFLQVFVDGGWVNMAELRYGASVGYFNRLHLTIGAIDVQQRTIHDINNLVEQEA